MSWLYTLVFAGLAFSSQDSSPVMVPVVEPDMVAAGVLIDETQRFEQTYPLTPGGRVSVENVNGSITLEAWDRSEVKLEYVKTADTREQLGHVDIIIDAKPDSFRVEADYPKRNWVGSGDNWRNAGKLTVAFRLMVPRAAMLNEIETVNGSATVSNFTNFTRVSAVNGSVKAMNLRGTANLSTVNGEVNADFDRLESGSKISLNTVNGSVKLMLPSDSNATVKADSLNGNITNDFGLPVRKGKYVGRDLHGRIGSGDVQIKLDSVNGSLSIGRKADGKSLSPAVDMLHHKTGDDSEWDVDDKQAAKSGKINKEVEKAIKASVKESAKAVAEAQVSLADLGPQIAKISVDSVSAATAAVNASIFNSERVQEQLRRAQERMANTDFFSTVPRIVKRSETFAVKGTPDVTIKGAGCSVTVRGWDKSEIEYRVTQFTDPRNTSDINMTESHTETSLRLTVENPSYQARSGTLFEANRAVRIEVFVPRKTNLKIDANGEIRLEGVSGNVELTGQDESVNVRDVDGKLLVSSADGAIRVIGFKGEVDARTTDGQVNLEGEFTKLTVLSTDAPVTLTLQETASATIDSTNEIEAGELALTKMSGDENRSMYRLGKGGPTFLIRTEGSITLRSANGLRAMNSIH